MKRYVKWIALFSALIVVLQLLGCDISSPIEGTAYDVNGYQYAVGLTGAKIVNTSSQNLNSGINILEFGTMRYDDDDYVVSDNKTLTAKQSGKYILTIVIYANDNGSATFIQAAILQNGNRIALTRNSMAYNTLDLTVITSTYANAGDNFTVQFYHDAGVLTIPYLNDYAPVFTIQRIGGN